MAESGRMTKGGLFTHFAERFGIKRTEAGEFFDELQQLTEQELLRCGEFVLPGVAKLVVQQREKRMGRNPATVLASLAFQTVGSLPRLTAGRLPHYSTPRPDGLASRVHVRFVQKYTVAIRVPTPKELGLSPPF